MMARGETIENLRTFKEPFRHRRCLVLANGFYDSEDIGSYLQPWHIHRRNDKLMMLEGFWEERSESRNFCLASALSNRVVARVIDRMTVILDPEQWDACRMICHDSLRCGHKVYNCKLCFYPFADTNVTA